MYMYVSCRGTGDLPYFVPMLCLVRIKNDRQNHRGTAFIRNNRGEWVKPNTPSMLGISPLAGDRVKRWRRLVKKRKSSILARCSPRHTRLPVGETTDCLLAHGGQCFSKLEKDWVGFSKRPAENGKKASLLRNWPSESKKC